MNAPIAIVGFARDPRMEPKAGDVVELGSLVRAVTFVREGAVAGQLFVSYKTTCGRPHKVSLQAWRAWAKKSQVTKVAA